MSPPTSRLQKLASHFVPSSSPPSQHHIHPLSPTLFLQRAAAIEPEAPAVYHITSSGSILERTYAQLASRVLSLAFYLRQYSFLRVGILAPNTPAFLELIFAIGAAGGVSVGANYRLKAEDVTYIFEHADCDCIVVDREFEGLLAEYIQRNPKIKVIVDEDRDGATGMYEDAVREGSQYEDVRGWDGLEDARGEDEDRMIAIPFTSGTTAKPKGVVYTHRGAYLAAMGNVVESGLNYHVGRCGYLWTLPMFHAVGWTFPWAVTAVRGTHFCLRKIDYPLIWRLLIEQSVTHFNAAPTVNTLLCAAKEAVRLDREVRVTVAASPPTAHLFESMTNLNLIPVHVYGLTETYGPLVKSYHMPSWESLPLKEKYARMARQGHGFITSLPLRVIKPDLPPGELVDVQKNGKEIGEVVFKGNICAKGYYKDEEATRKLFEGGVLHSGDLAVWCEDGSMQILDRAKDIIISGQFNPLCVSSSPIATITTSFFSGTSLTCPRW